MKTLSDSLPHRLMLTDTVVLLARPLYPKSWHFKPRLALGASFSLSPPNCEMLSNDEMDTRSSQISSIIAVLPYETTVQVINQVVPSVEADAWAQMRRRTPDDLQVPVSWQQQTIETGGRYSGPLGIEGRLRESRVIWTVRVPLVLPRRNLWPLIRSPFALSAKRMGEVTKEIIGEFDSELADFEALCQMLHAQFASIGLEPKTHGATDLLQTIDTALGSTHAVPPVYHPGTPLAAQVGNEDLIFDRDTVAYQNQVAHVFTLHNLPPKTATSMLSGQRVRDGGKPLAIWDGQDDQVSQVVTNIYIPDVRTVETNVAFKELKATIEVSSTDNKKGDLSFSTASVSDDIQLFREQMYNQSACPAYVTSHIVLWGSSDAELKIKGTSLRSRVRTGLNAQLIRESNLTPALFKQCLPLGCDYEFPDQRHIQRSRLVTSINAADMVPLYGAFRGTENRTPAVMFQNRLGELVYCDHFDYPSGHALVTGTTGGGKSFLINHLVAQVLPIGASVVILDRLASYQGLCQAYGGDHISIDFDNPVIINPFMGPGNEEHRVRLAALLGAILGEVTATEDGVMSEAVNELFDEHHSQLQLEPTMSEFANVLRRPHTDWGGTGTDLALRLAPFYRGGRFAGFIDGQSSFELNDRLTVFELSELDSAPQLQTAIAMSLMQILADYFGDLERLNRRKYLINDEVWALLLHPASAQVLVNIARTYRKRRTAAIFISQHPSDFWSEAGEIIKGLCSIRYFLQMEEEVIDAMIESYALSPQEARMLKTVRRGHQYSECYLRLRDRQGGVVRLVADPFTLYMASQEDLSIAPRMSEQMARNGGNFQSAISSLIKEDHHYA